MKKMRVNIKTWSFLLVVLFLVSCSNSRQAATKESLLLGETTFNKNCVACHGSAGVGLVKDWKIRLENGKYPPPPLNGTAHAWHHPPKGLLSVINNGGARFGGWMPAFGNRLTEKEKLALIDYIYSLWPKYIQKKYDARFK